VQEREGRFLDHTGGRFARANSDRDARIARVATFEVSFPPRFSIRQNAGVTHVECLSETRDEAAAIDKAVLEGGVLLSAFHGPF
jgi:hypothetical protein